MKLNKLQAEALKRIWQRNIAPGGESYLKFRRTVMPELCGAAMVKCGNIWIGIEKDGYPHS